MGEYSVAQPGGRTLYARADLPAFAYAAQALMVEADEVPARHASISGWPDAQSARQLIALARADAATLHIVPPPRNPADAHTN